jgi:hypothetical protein
MYGRAKLDLLLREPPGLHLRGDVVRYLLPESVIDGAAHGCAVTCLSLSYYLPKRYATPFQTHGKRAASATPGSCCSSYSPPASPAV